MFVKEFFVSVIFELGFWVFMILSFFHSRFFHIIIYVWSRRFSFHDCFFLFGFWENHGKRDFINQIRLISESNIPKVSQERTSFLSFLDFSIVWVSLKKKMGCLFIDYFWYVLFSVCLTGFCCVCFILLVRFKFVFYFLEYIDHRLEVDYNFNDFFPIFGSLSNKCLGDGPSVSLFCELPMDWQGD